jgi:hypothetical protein
MSHEHSAILIDGIQKGTLQRCPHCGGHFLVAKDISLDMGRRALGNVAHPRVRCQKCDRLTCGRRPCDPLFCVPAEARLEHVEGKTTRYEDSIAALKEKGVVII